MPIINLKISGKQDLQLAKLLSGSITALTKEHLSKSPLVTAITVTFIPNSLWFINGLTLEDLDLKSFYLNIKVTESTNLKDQKAVFIHSIYALFTSLADRLHPTSYVYSEEVKADAYGYSGLTMEHRYINY